MNPLIVQRSLHEVAGDPHDGAQVARFVIAGRYALVARNQCRTVYVLPIHRGAGDAKNCEASVGTFSGRVDHRHAIEGNHALMCEEVWTIGCIRRLGQMPGHHHSDVDVRAPQLRLERA